ncbi:hypothetical protein [Mucilaginibacter sp. L3T2-6]|uniref:hypothetical protein n=1 Tax=Mucilaginibacter sp. L3T2-6 TaxID=3062491 RepID=UPI0026750413|nr:hypothetical protein [Mucilaginibacter sp. L3T2-6]MDO3642476.1 hypothetical protein [Mucilaginibacter sp. L3T2-6]MDV6215128.1 hypothetical protein [Mucilaginibacter sp. L3T2-6]
MTGIFITARLGSTRLLQKHLIKAGGSTFIEYLINRFAAEFKNDIAAGDVKLFITTSTDPENMKFEEVLDGIDINIFFGADDNIPLRHLQCAEEHNVDNILSIDGDDILCSTKAARDVMYSLIEGASMAKTVGLPLGMNVMGYTKDFLRHSLINTPKILETGWGRIFDESHIDIINFDEISFSSKLRMTLDYEPDADFFRAVINEIKKDITTISDENLIKYIIENELHKINSELNEQYWANFNLQKNNGTSK